jgi:hypothetical protein
MSVPQLKEKVGITMRNSEKEIRIMIGSSERYLETADESWINQQINCRRQDRQWVCVRVAPDRRSSNLRIKKTFTDSEKDKFLAEAFEYIATYFEGSLSELQTRNREVETDFRRIDANHFGAVIYVSGSEVNRCKIWLSATEKPST